MNTLIGLLFSLLILGVVAWAFFIVWHMRRIEQSYKRLSALWQAAIEREDWSACKQYSVISRNFIAAFSKVGVSPLSVWRNWNHPDIFPKSL